MRFLNWKVSVLSILYVSDTSLFSETPCRSYNKGNALVAIVPSFFCEVTIKTMILLIKNEAFLKFHSLTLKVVMQFKKI